MAAIATANIRITAGPTQEPRLLHLQLKNTFVDVIDADTQGAAPARRQSDPNPSASSLQSFRLVQDDEAYIEELQEHVRLGSLSRCSSKASASRSPTKDVSRATTKDASLAPKEDGRASSRGSFSACSEATATFELPEEMLCPLSPAKSTSSKLSWADIVDAEVPEPPEPFGPFVTPALRATTSTRTACTGSVGHPFLCNHPCKNLRAQGNCPDGAACDFCHLPHEGRKRLTHLDKKNRTTLREMDARSKVELLWPVLQEKVEALAVGPNATHALLRWFQEVDAALPSRAGAQDPALLDSDGKRLFKCLKAMSVVEICRTPGAGEGGGCIREASERLLGELRAASLAAES